jgi:hypothetical protein
MADLTADAPLRLWDSKKVFSETWVLDNSAAQTIYKGHPMIIDIGTDTIYPRGFLDATVVAATDIFIGIAAEPKSVATTDTETDNEIEIYVDGTIIGFQSAVYTDADVGDTVYMSDSGTLSATAADNPQLGKLHRVVDGYAYVQLITPTVTTGA